MNKKIKTAFLLSIIVNVLLLGVVLGGLPRWFSEPASRQEQMERRIKELPEPAQTRFREKMEQIRKEVEPMRDQIREARRAAIGILTTEPFDEAAYDRQVEEIGELRVRMGKRMAEGIKEVAKELPQDQRMALAKVLDRPPRQ
jgi:uncharacterized membrane protein